MQVVRLFSGDDGESHFEELELSYEDVVHAQATAMRSASGIQFRRSPPGHFIDWHHAPQLQFVITLAGQSKIVVGDGSQRIFSIGDVLLADDHTGRGHTTEVVGNEHRASVFVPLVD